NGPSFRRGRVPERMGNPKGRETELPRAGPITNNRVVKSFLYFELVALLAGALLACLVEINSAVALKTSATFSSLMNHATGSIFGILALTLLFGLSKQRRAEAQAHLIAWRKSSKRDAWLYLSGIAGAMVVVCITLATNSPLGDVGALAMLFLGQILAGILMDQMGWFGQKERSVSRIDLLQIALILSGTSMLIFYARPK
ncbi:MAG: DMT family transporter, partial [Bdellovibrionales bacterium]|nr:DMT family transporter [Bdellovibrionales bacterium]